MYTTYIDPKKFITLVPCLDQSEKTMDKTGVGPEEPIFYGVIIGFLIYFLFIFIKWRNWKIRKSIYASQIENEMVHLQSQIDAVRHQLSAALGRIYGNASVEAAFKGEIYHHMPVTLLKVALGNPQQVSFQGQNKQTWKYRLQNQQEVLIYMEDGKILDWQKIQLSNG